LNGDDARAFITDPDTLAEVAAADAHIRSLGVTGVPFFIFNQKVSVSGAQDPVTLLGAMKRSLEPRN
jgi:predicted DsbA family dithiol-disulfide isomerase